MSPTIVRDKQGNNVMALGSPGSARIISSVTQTIQYWIDITRDIVEAVSYPRVHVNGQNAYLEFVPSSVLTEWIENQGYVQPKISDELGLNGLNAYFGGINAVAFEDETWVGAADPRRDGTVGYSENLK